MRTARMRLMPSPLGPPSLAALPARLSFAGWKPAIPGITAAICLLLVLLPLGAAAGAAGAPVLHGRVSDMSSGKGHPVAALPVEVQIRRNGQTLGAVTGRTDAHGNFALAPPPLPKGAQYAVVTVYKRVPYDVAVPAKDVGRRIQVPVYDTTPADSGIAAMRVIVGVRRVGQKLRVIEQWPFANTGMRTIIGGDPASGRGAASFTLPPGATNVTVGTTQPAPATGSVQGNRVVVNTVIRPATGLNAASLHQVTFTFDVPLRSGRPTLLIPTRYFVGSLYVFAVGSHLAAPGFKTSSLPLNGKSLPALERDSIPPDSTLAVGVGGPPAVASKLGSMAAPTAATAAASLPAFPTAAVIGVIEAGFVLLLLFALRGRLPALVSTRDRLELQRERARLVGALAELDAQRAAGRVGENEYHRRRSREKGRLLAVARQLGE